MLCFECRAAPLETLDAHRKLISAARDKRSSSRRKMPRVPTTNGWREADMDAPHLREAAAARHDNLTFVDFPSSTAALTATPPSLLPAKRRRQAAKGDKGHERARGIGDEGATSGMAMLMAAAGVDGNLAPDYHTADEPFWVPKPTESGETQL
jgi:hypothetical protein